MNKKYIAIGFALSLMGSAQALATSSTYQDNLQVVFEGFDPNTMLFESYRSNNSVDIVGPQFTKTDAPAVVTISSDITQGVGYPSMSVMFTGSPNCKITFADGPHRNLDFKEGNPPFCADMGLIVGNIVKISNNHYTMVIKKLQ
ncbi:MAG: hypothetical protein A3C44_02040 [Gammaproteobacteria bacterium RIFCSPHIGHO2_02_FULL_39_13]|nr:MAG: hypothetical protein A3C44_02040 [Gammaproteobacteria bacterium RIFCSPHIGHO2_02_FULL_39_13]OGT48317.1 MAG: hypothetical protein A3E53_05735 [Gammaproteobacteria bacterium RIFCSPHIGHO2_12_FULL_39_24]